MSVGSLSEARTPPISPDSDKRQRSLDKLNVINVSVLNCTRIRVSVTSSHLKSGEAKKEEELAVSVTILCFDISLVHCRTVRASRHERIYDWFV